MRRGQIMPVQYNYLKSRKSLRDRKSKIFCMRLGHKNNHILENLKFCVYLKSIAQHTGQTVYHIIQMKLRKSSLKIMKNGISESTILLWMMQCCGVYSFKAYHHSNPDFNNNK